MVEFNDATNIVTVYHIGHHKCSLQVDTQCRNSLIKSRIQDRQLTGPAKEVSLLEIVWFIEKGKMEMAKVEAEAWVDWHAVKRKWILSIQVV